MENQSDTECSNDGDYQQSIEYPERNDLVACDNDETDNTEVESGDNEDNSPYQTQGDGDFSGNTSTSALFGATDSFPTENVDGTMSAEESSRDHQEVNRAFFDDVIGGRGKQTCNHFGNQNFRRLIRTHCETYGALVGNAKKTRFVEDIVTEVKLTGRFLKTKKAGKSFVEMTDEEAKRKVGQSLRYELRKVQNQRG